MNQPLHPQREPAAEPFGARLIIFDLDGTLLDSVPDIAAAVDRSLLDLGLPAPGEERVRRWVGNGAPKLLERALHHAGDRSSTTLDRALTLFLEHYGWAFTVRSRLYPGVAEVVARLAAEGRRLAVCTNKPSQFVVPLLEHFGLVGSFSAGIGGDDLPTMKPDPAPLHHLAARFGAVAEDCLVVGDSRTDVEAARAAGMPVVAVSYGYNHGADIRDSAPDATIDSMAQLPPLLAPFCV